jgi:hypothetical protein
MLRQIPIRVRYNNYSWFQTAGERAASAIDDIRRNQRRIPVADAAFEAGPEPVMT